MTEVGKLITLNLEAAKLEVGVYDSLFDCPTKITWMNTNNSWILDTLYFCQKHKICFDEPALPLTPNCYNDVSLMEAMSRMPFSPDQLRLINNCRLFWRVISLLDVTDGGGKHLLLPSMLKPVQ